MNALIEAVRDILDNRPITYLSRADREMLKTALLSAEEENTSPEIINFRDA